MEQCKKPLIGIIGGTSQFGQWFKYFFENNGCECLVAGRSTKLTPKKLAAMADIVIVSVPPRATARIINEIREAVKPSSLLCDFTSIKEAPLKEMLNRKKGGVLGMHPLFGPLVSSMKGQKIVFCHGRDDNWKKFLKNIFEKNGAKIIEMNAREHDRQMAMIQAMTHFVSIAFAKVLQKQKIEPQNDFSTPVFRLQAMLMGRVLGANPSLYSDLQVENEAYKKVLEEYVKEVGFLSAMVYKKDAKSFESEILSAARAMKDFIPIAQAKTSEILHILDAQPVEISKRKKQLIKIGSGQANAACLGPKGTYSHLAAKQIFSSAANLVMLPTVMQVFKSVMDNEVKYGVVPAENSTQGIIQDTLDNLYDYPLNVVGSHKMAIRHCLLARTKDRQKITAIKSHMQPIAQCKDWLFVNFPNAKLIPEASSTGAILSTTEKSIAFIGNRESAEKYGLEILAENIEDNKNNTTDFYILSRNNNKQLSKQLKAKHTLLIITVYDRPGILRDVLNVFADRGLNLAKLHSRASRVKNWDYYFFLEVESLPDTALFKQALKEVNKYCSIVRVAGVV